MPAKVLRVFLLMALLLIVQAALPALLFGAPLGGVLLNVYIAVGLACWLVEVAMHQLGQDEVRSNFEEQIIAVANRQNKFAPWRGAVLGALTVLQRIACWPAFELGLHNLRMWQNGVRLHSRLAKATASGLFPYDVSVSLFLAFAAGLATLIALWTGHASVYGRAFLWLLIGAAAAKHLAALVSPRNIQQRLQRAIDPVVLSYVIITLSDLACLLLAYNGVINWTNGPVLTGASLRQVYDLLHAFKDVLGAWEHLPRSVLGYAAAISGLLWLFTLANSVLKIFSTSARTTDDNLAIAISCAMVGLDRRARVALESTDPTTREQFELKGIAYASLGEYERAAPFIAEFLRQLMLGKSAPSPDYTMIELFDPVPVVPESTETFAKLLAYGAEHGMSDTFLATFALQTRSFGADARELAERMEREGLHHRFPLGFVCFKWLVDQEREVHAFYDALDQPPPGADRATWRCCAALMIPSRKLSTEAMIQAIHDWVETEPTAILADIETATPLDILLLVHQLGRIHGYLGQRDVAMDALAATISALEVRIGDDPLVARKLRLAGLSVPTQAPGGLDGVRPARLDTPEVAGA